MSNTGQDAFLGRGWAFPPSFTAGGADVETVAGADDVHQSLQILLGTVPGERVMQEAFGCDLQGLVFAELDQKLVNSVQKLVEDAIVTFEPRVTLDQVDAQKSTTEAACLMVSVQYTVRATNSRFNMVFPFYLMEATPLGV